MYQILIAEDELIERMMLKKNIQKYYGAVCQVFEAENGRMALDIFRRESIDLVILDIEMPGIKGIEAAEEMRKINRFVPIIFLTAFDKFIYAKRAISVGAMEYLLKPYHVRELVSVLGEAIRRVEEQSLVAEKENSKHSRSPALTSMMLETSDLSQVVDGAFSSNQMPEGDQGKSRSKALVDMIEEFVRENYNKSISLKETAEAVNYSEPYLSKLFKEQFGQNFISYLTEYRLDEAKKLLRQPHLSVKEIGNRTGYHDTGYFSRVFKKLEGCSPNEYRRKHF